MSDTAFDVVWLDPVLGEARESLRKQARVLDHLSGQIDENFSRAVRLLLSVRGHVIIAGLGKSGLVGRKIASTFASTGTPSFFLHGAEALHGDLGMVTEDDAVICLSHSGETPEISCLASALRQRDIPIVAMTSRSESTLARTANVLLQVEVERELCPENLAPTNSSIATMAIGHALAVAMMRARSFGAEQFHQLHPAGSLGSRLRPVGDAVEKAPRLQPETSLQEALLALAGSTVPAATVLEGSELLGVVCHRSIAAALKIHGPSAPVRHAVCPDTLVVDAEMRVSDVLDRLRESTSACEAAVVVDGPICLGVFIQP